MGRRIWVMVAGLVLIGVLCWANGAWFEQRALGWLEAEAKARAGLCVSAEHVALAFADAAPALALRHVRISRDCGDAARLDAETVTVSPSPWLFSGSAGAIDAGLAGLRAEADADWLLAATPGGVALKTATVEIFDPALSETAPGKMTLTAPRAHILVDPGKPEGPVKAALRLERDGRVFNLSLTQAQDSQGDGQTGWAASLDQPGRPALKGQGSFALHGGGTQIKADRLWVGDKGVDVDATVAIGSDRLVTAVVDIAELVLDSNDRLSGATVKISDGRPEVQIGPVKDIIWPGIGSWRLDATLACGALRIGAAHVGKLRLQVIAQGDELDLRAVSDQVYTGRLRARYVQNGQEASHQLSGSLTAVDVKALLRDVNGFDGLAGLGSARVDVQGSGRKAEELAASLEGSSDFVVEDGALDIGRFAAGKQRNQLFDIALQFAPRLAISKASGSFALRSGLATTNDIAFTGPDVRGTGAGTVDFNDRLVDFRIIPKIQVKARSLAVPITFKGAWSSPEVSANADALLNSDAIGGLLGDYGLGGDGRGKIDLFDFFKSGADQFERR